ncbi:MULTISPECIES: MmpS family transport accessory protein [unclassified Micromonospora]|uniref:MmpS family transport accessory protein n=1 Tax=unclassified Micromonospora TaxID=2617518 RepID=UPI0033D4A827
MSETTPSPEPAPGPADPTAAPATPQPSSWTPPDPLAAPQPWTPPEPWSPSPAPSPWAAPGPESASGTDPATSPSGAGRPVGGPGWAAPADPAAPPAPGDPQSSGVPGGPGWPAQPGVPGSSAQPGWTPGAYPPGSYPPGPYPPAPYPPPYAHPGGLPRRSAGGWVAGLVVGIVTVLALIVCCCVGLSFLGRGMDSTGASGERYDGPLYGEPDGPPGWADEPSRAPARPATTPSGGPGKFTVLYEVTATDGEAEVQFYDADANFHQPGAVDTPWRLSFTANDRERVQIIASPVESGDVTCRITVNGKVVSKDSGEYGATCFGW